MPRRRRSTIRRTSGTSGRTTLGRSGEFVRQPTGTPTRDTLSNSDGTPATPRPAMPAPTLDWIFNNDVAANRAAYDTGMAGIGLQRGRLSFDTGFAADGSVDLSNPYSQAMMLQRSWEQGQRGINNSMAARGQGYSGARRNAINESNFQYERNRSGLATQAQRGYEDLTLDERSLSDQLYSGNADALAGQSSRWLDAENDWYRNHG